MQGNLSSAIRLFVLDHFRSNGAAVVAAAVTTSQSTARTEVPPN
jgi:hypothetical protein